MNSYRKNVADLCLDQLQAWGVQRVYGVIGDAILPFVSAFEGRDGITFIPTRHEEAAAFMAKADAQTTGILGVCTATSGPGTAHLVNGLADAKFDSAPVLAITGQVESFKVGTVSKQMVDQQRLLEVVTGYTHELQHPDALVDVLPMAMRAALFQGTAAHISIPKDYWEAYPSYTHVKPYPQYLRTPARSTYSVISDASHLLANAERPAILAGIGARGAIGQVLQLAEHLHAPVIYTLAASGQFPGYHHLVVGGIGEGGADSSVAILSEADCILRIGTTWWPELYTPSQANVIDINVRPDHIGIGVSSAYGIVGPVEEVVPQLLHTPTTSRWEWESRVRELREEWNQRLEAEISSGSRGYALGVHPACTVRHLNQHMPEDAIITLDVGEHVLWFNRYFKGNGRQDVLLSGYWRSMGFGLPAAIAAKLAAPHRSVVALIGDGGFGMVLAELLTAVRLNVPITIVVMNNNSLAMEENEMAREGLVIHGVSLNNPNFAQYAALCGAQGYRVENEEELKRALSYALHAERPAVVDVVTPTLPLPQPRTAQAQPVLV